ncbi:adenine deaminase [Oceaniglobus trochenteri]|uniref:adenine deaminase n=1 Tax=Oceaniglobus trochenteri TaxID=2763260 RepID=UPI001CFF866C|nr:adenine deaminase C-terminal domain-containing protein [Oceaniglobus trochenteri]
MTREPDDLNDAALRDRAVAAARGDAPFDLLITGATLVDVITGELRPADIGCTGALIASVHPKGSRKDALETIDATGLFATPGLIDAHMHVESSMVTPEIYAAAVLPRGVTTVVWDPHEFANVAGLNGMAYAIDCAKDSPLRILTLAPSCVPSAPGYETAGADFTSETLSNILSSNDIHGLAEVMDMAAVTSRAPRMRAILQAALESGKNINGHARSLTGSDLQAYVSAGVSSDHELTSGEDLLEKLRAGLWVEMRGSHDHLLPEFVEALKTLPQQPSTLTLCTDDVFPDDLHRSGGLDDVLRRLVRYGMAPIDALRAATHNAAQRLRRADLGVVAPGRRADVVLFEDLEGFTARHVLRDGALVKEVPQGKPIPTQLSRTCDISSLNAANFMLRAKGPKVRIATIDQPRFTRWGETTLAVDAGTVMLPADHTRIAVIHRHGMHPATPSLGVLRGWGTWRGAFATTVSHDSHNLTVFGHDPEDMALAANTLIEAGGGMVATSRGKVLALLPLPVAGLVSDHPLAEVGEAFAAVRSAMDRVVDWQPPYLVFKALVGATLACNAGPHQTDLGTADPQGGRLLRSPILEDGLA